ncbi:hypothetical protein A5664_01715 [Mycolicibacterium fortuitum]|nr:hypothetical protein A5664_01715 [Mycolicibacterium fortuitum]
MAEIWLLDAPAVDSDELPRHGFSVDGYAVVLEPDAGSLENPHDVERGTVLQSLNSIVVALALAAVTGGGAVRCGADLMPAGAGRISEQSDRSFHVLDDGSRHTKASD